ncbi:MAG: glyoxalase [Pseudanabaena sp.]|nr:MAG: glyoxalase [Pseudanabaena sp.]
MSVKLKTVGVIVKDMKKTLDFYQHLGLAIPAGSDREENLDLELPNGIVIGFLTEQMAKSADPQFITPVGQAINLQFEYDSPEEVDAIYAKLIGLGYESYREPWDAFWGQRFARVKDPDYGIVNLYAQLNE